MLEGITLCCPTSGKARNVLLARKNVPTGWATSVTGLRWVGGWVGEGRGAYLGGDEEPDRSHDRGEEDEGVERRDHCLGPALPGAGQQPLQRGAGEEQEPQP